MVYWTIWRFSGQMTFFISIFVSLKKRLHALLASCAFSVLVAVVLRFALAMLAPQFNQKKLFGFFMKGVFMAPFAVFHQFYTLGSGLFVLVRTIIAALAFCACKSNSFTHYLHLIPSFFGRRPINMLDKYITNHAVCASRKFALKKAGPSQRFQYCSIRGDPLQGLL